MIPQGGSSSEEEKKDEEGTDDNGTQEDADRSGQRPGAGDPREAHDPAAGRTEPDSKKV